MPIAQAREQRLSTETRTCSERLHNRPLNFFLPAKAGPGSRLARCLPCTRASVDRGRRQREAQRRGEDEMALHLPCRRLRDHSIESARMQLRLASDAITFLDALGSYAVSNEHGAVVHYRIEADPKLSPA